MQCPKCGKENSSGQKFCLQCGTKLIKKHKKVLEKENQVASNIREVTKDNLNEIYNEDIINPNIIKEYNICPKCGTENNITSKFCCSCGNVLKDEEKQEKNESKKKIVICPICGKKNQGVSKFCSFCGFDLENCKAFSVMDDVKKKSCEAVKNDKSTMGIQKDITSKTKEDYSINKVINTSKRKKNIILTSIACIFVIFLGILIIFLNHNSDEIVFCTSFASNGKPIGVSKSFTPGVVELSVDNGSKLETSEIKLIMYKDIDGRDQVLDTAIRTVDPNWTSFHIGYTFEDPARYRAQFINTKTGKVIAEGKVSIHY